MTPTVEVCLISVCNFHCDYCIAGSNHAQNYVMVDGKKEWIQMPLEYTTDSLGLPIIIDVNEETSNDVYRDIFRNGYFSSNQVINIRRLIYYIKKHLMGWTVVISGGEPLLYPNIDRWLDVISKTNDIILLTNASRIQKHSSILSNPKIFLRVGYHPEYRELDEFYENMTFIKNHTNNYVVNYVHHPRHRDNSKDIEYIEFLKTHAFNYEISPFKGTYKDVEYGYDHGFFDNDIISPHFKNEYPETEKLVPGMSFLTIYGDGLVYACHRKKGLNGRVNDGDLTLIPSTYNLHCLDEGVCQCDSMRSYNYIETKKNIS